MSAEDGRVAARLDELADLLEGQGADRCRILAYRRAAERVRRLGPRLREIHREEGREGLRALPDIGESLARAIDEMLTTGRWAQLERLRGESAPERLFRTIPGIGPKLAARLHDELHLDTLEELEAAAHDGRLETVEGIGPRTAAMLRDTLAARLARRGPRRDGPREEPSVDLLLEVDRLYRERAAADRLPRIAPKRFNPDGEAWLPILHLDRAGWSFAALYSNTALAHELGRTDDWVVIHFTRDEAEEGQRTVVTETRGPRRGRRVVRGREGEGAAAA